MAWILTLLSGKEHGRRSRQQAGVRVLAALLAGVALLNVTAAARGAGCPAGCLLTYAPVSDVATGLPFYNECLARCQLGPDAELLPAAAANDGGSDDEATAAGAATRFTAAAASSSSSSAHSSARSPRAADYLRLIPQPQPEEPQAAASCADDAARGGDGSATPKTAARSSATTTTVSVTEAIITRFTKEGFVYVGRPGFMKPRKENGGAGSCSAERGDPGSSTSTSNIVEGDTATVKRSAGTAPGAIDADGTRVTLRMTSPEGDMYMKVWSRAELRTLESEYRDPESGLPTPLAAALSRGVQSNGSRAARVPLSSGTTAAADSQQSETAEGGGAGGHTIFGGDARWEVKTLVDPYMAVTRIMFDSAANGRPSECSGSLAGSTHRLVLTAGHCLYHYDTNSNHPVGWNSNFWVAPGANQGIAPYGWHPVDMLEVQSRWDNNGDWASDIGVARLSYHVPEPGITLGYGCECGAISYDLTTAGYPEDKDRGTMWSQNTAVNTDVCTGSAEKRWMYDAHGGQSGSAFWTVIPGRASGYATRFVHSNTDVINQGAVAITPSYFSWLSDFVIKNILTTPPRILVGGVDRDLFVSCDTIGTRRCWATRNRIFATDFNAYPVAQADKFALQIPGHTLCLGLSGGGASGDLNLYPCNSDQEFKFGPSSLWWAGTSSAAGGIEVVKSDSGGYLWWDDSGDLTAVPSCWQWQAGHCTWRLEPPVGHLEASDQQASDIAK